MFSEHVAGSGAYCEPRSEWWMHTFASGLDPMEPWPRIPCNAEVQTADKNSCGRTIDTLRDRLVLEEMVKRGETPRQPGRVPA
jgi:hypothetical protein